MADMHKKQRIARLIGHAILVIIGNALLAFGYAAFAVPSGFIVGGASGLALVIQKFVPLSLAQAVFILNVILFIIGYIFLGKEFAMGTVVSSFVYPLFLELFGRYEALTHLTDDTLLACLFAGLLVGGGLGIVLRLGYSTGGMDIPPIILSKKTGIEVGTLMNASDVIILMLQVPFTNVEGVLYGIVCVLVTGIVINKTMLLGDAKVQCVVISRKYNDIADMVFKDIGRGLTFIDITTGYMLYKGEAVMVVMSRREYATFGEKVAAIDPDAFIITSEVYSVRGRGFTLPNVDLQSKRKGHI